MARLTPCLISVLLLDFCTVAFCATIADIFVSTTPELIRGGFVFTEGPVWRNSSQTFIFSDIPQDRIHELSFSPQTLREVRRPSAQSNGLALTTEGRLVACEHQGRRVSISRSSENLTEKNTLATTYEGKRLNSPNDLALHSDGSIYFTDPPYGISPAQEEMGFNGVWRISSEGTLQVLANDFNRPNGITFSTDEKYLFVADTVGNHVRRFEVTAEGTLQNSQIFIPNAGAPDGMKVDQQDNLYVATNSGVRVYDKSGQLIGRAAEGIHVYNLCFGGLENTDLFLTCGANIYKLSGRIEGKPTDGRALSDAGFTASVETSEETSAGVTINLPVLLPLFAIFLF